MSSDLHSEIDFVKTMAQAGNAGPLRSGYNLFWAGICFGAASLVQYGMLTHNIPMPSPWWISLNWLGAAIVFVVLMFMRPKSAQAKNCSASNRASKSVWSAVGLSIFAFIVCLFIVAAKTNQIETISFVIAPYVLLVYGIGWWVSATMSGQSWLKWVAAGCFLTAPALALLTGKTEQILAYAACLVLFATLPGLKLMQDERGHG